jgi:DNA mismatch repair ATPase MutS
MDPRVRIGHMDCLVQGKSCNMNIDLESFSMIRNNEQDDNDNNTEDEEEEVTFLYRLCDGACPKSYGINVARLANLPNEVVARAAQQSRLFESKINLIGSNTSETTTIRNHYDQISMFFEKLVSLSQSGIEGDELLYIATELWRRYNHIKNNN